jgi:hypothetical protein
MVVYGAANGLFNARWQSIDDWSFRRIKHIGERSPPTVNRIRAALAIAVAR